MEARTNAPLRSFQTLLLCALPLLLVLPFDPYWPDFERARRAIFCIFVGLGSLLAMGGSMRRPSTALLWLFAFVPLSLVSTVWARDRGAAISQSIYFLALFSLPLLLPTGRNDRRQIANAFAIAVLLSSVYGMLQALGLDWPAHYASPSEPVSTLGNRNVAAEWTAIAALFCLLAGPRIGWPALFLAASYAWLNGGRAALIALHAGVLCYGVLRLLRYRSKRELRVFLSLSVLLILAIPLGLSLRHTKPPSADTGAKAASVTLEPSTTHVRWLLYKSTLRMIRRTAPLGVGAGNFQADFPRYRDREEIAISSLGGKITTRVARAHDDPLQLVAELGAPAALLLFGFAFAIFTLLRRRRLTMLGLAALLAFAPIAAFRAPLWNAPAAAGFLILLGMSLAPARLRSPKTRWRFLLAACIGVPTLLFGLGQRSSEDQGAAFARAQRAKNGPEALHALDQAIAIPLSDPDYRLLRAQLLRKNPSLMPEPRKRLARILDDLDQVLGKRPGDYSALLEVGWLGLSERSLRERGEKALAQLRDLYGDHPIGEYLEGDYSGMREVLLLLGKAKKKRSSRTLSLGMRVLADLEARYPHNLDLVRLRLEYELYLFREDEILKALGTLKDKALLLRTVKQLRVAIPKASDTLKRRIRVLILRCLELGKGQFPDAPEFR